MTDYIQVPIGPSDGRRLYCEFVAIAATHELEIPTPSVHFFLHRPAPDGWPLQAWSDERHLAGETRWWEPDAVWVKADLPRAELATVVAHECHHLSWFQRYGGGYYSPQEEALMEKMADDFASRFTRRHHRNGGRT